MQGSRSLNPGSAFFMSACPFSHPCALPRTSAGATSLAHPTGSAAAARAASRSRSAKMSHNFQMGTYSALDKRKCLLDPTARFFSYARHSL